MDAYDAYALWQELRPLCTGSPTPIFQGSENPRKYSNARAYSNRCHQLLDRQQSFYVLLVILLWLVIRVKIFIM